MKLRIGQGFDVHKTTDGNHLIIGGVKLSSSFGIEAHSDGDVLIHAVIDSLLGAMGLGDIGSFFPDNDDKYRNISSLVLLKETKFLLDKNNYSVINIDSTVVLQEPKLSVYRSQMRKNIAKVLEISHEDVSVKFTTTEKLGFEGEKKGISAQAVCLIQKNTV